MGKRNENTSRSTFFYVLIKKWEESEKQKNEGK
jgi:hypothetical protein